MLPLATSGPAVLGVVVISALALVWALLRTEAHDDAREDSEREP